MTNSQLKLGHIYQHYKGKKYKVLDIVRHSETLEEMVLYETQYDNEYGKLWVRPLAMFLENVEVDGEAIPRFRFCPEG